MRNDLRAARRKRIFVYDKVFKYRISNADNTHTHTHRGAAGVPQSAVVLSCSSPSLQSKACDYCSAPLSCLTASLIFPPCAAYCTIHQPRPFCSLGPQRTLTTKGSLKDPKYADDPKVLFFLSCCSLCLEKLLSAAFATRSAVTERWDPAVFLPVWIHDAGN